MSVLGFADVDIDAMQKHDTEVAEEHDARRGHLGAAFEARRSTAK